MAQDDPSKPSGAYNIQAPYWRMVSRIMRGIRAMRDGGVDYLPQFEGEDRTQYIRRLRYARMTNVFGDIVDDLAMRPFKQPVQLSEETAPQFKEFADDVNGSGDKLTVFASRLFCHSQTCLLYTSPSPRDRTRSRMPSSA